MDEPNKDDENCQERPNNTNFEEIFYQSPIGILLYDKEGKLTNANDSALNIARIPKLDDVLGTNIFDNPIFASKKEDLQKKGLIKFQDSLDLIKIKEQNIYNPIEPKIIEIDWIVSVTDSGYLIQIQDITKQKEIEKYKQSLFNEVQNERDMLSALINNIPDEVWFADNNKKFTLANPSALHEFGLYPRNIDVEEMASNLDVYRSDGSPRPIDEAPPLRALKGEIIRNLEEIIRVPSRNELRYRQVNASPVKDSDDNIIGSVSVVRDITESKKTEEALLVSEKRYHELFTSMTEMFQVIELIYDTKGKPIDYFYRDVNPAFCGLVGKTKEELIDKRVKNIFGIVEDYWLEKYDKVEKTGNPIQFENYGAELDKWYEVNVWKLMENQVAIIFTDTTERKHREEREKKIIDELTRSNIELERFAYVSSHDLQEPLRMITLYSQLLERRYKDRLDSDADDFIEYIVDNAKRMKYLIDDLLEYSRITSQAKEFENIDLDKILESVLSNLSITIVENNVNVTHDSLPTVFADKNQIFQVFENLITNAIKFREKKSPKIDISVQKGEKECTFAVKDNGIGINRKHQEQIFDVFKRLHTREEYPGTGIGLSIVQKIIERHNGRIWVESELRKGSTFYFTIPI